MQPSSGSPVSALAALLAAGALLLCGGCGSAARPARRAAASVSPARIARIERRVEALRGLRFLRPVPVAVISPAQARRAGLADFDRGEPPARRLADDELLKLLGLLQPGDDSRRIAAAIYDQQVAGFYDPRTKHLALVRGAGVDDLTLAHELTHALEDQHFDLQRLESGSDVDAADGQQALTEGTATYVEEQYALRYPGAASFGEALGALAQSAGGTPLPPYVMRELLFPYLTGLRFVGALVRLGGWPLVNVALRVRPPASTAEVIDPARWVRVMVPMAVSLPAPGRSWRRLAGSTLGQEDLAELLRIGVGAAAAQTLATTWRGGRDELWRRGRLPAAGCAAPCRARDALALALRAGGAAGRRGLAAGLAAWLRVGLRAQPVGAGAPAALWRLPGGSFAALGGRGLVVRVALAPDAALARRLAGA